jgi:hypothetical protein
MRQNKNLLRDRFLLKRRIVIACDKRKAFAQGSKATKQSISPQRKEWIASAFAKASADKSLRSQ